MQKSPADCGARSCLMLADVDCLVGLFSLQLVAVSGSGAPR
jgi:hypothetical protein